jgi:hypothetical protein
VVIVHTPEQIFTAERLRPVDTPDNKRFNRQVAKYAKFRLSEQLSMKNGFDPRDENRQGVAHSNPTPYPPPKTALERGSLRA